MPATIINSTKVKALRTRIKYIIGSKMRILHYNAPGHVALGVA